MGKPTGFMEYQRQDPGKRSVAERVQDYAEIEQPLSDEALQTQAARCMDCGIPFCHSHGCPLQNLIPDWNDMIYRGHWRRALELLNATNNLPEITGRICPAPCETSCTLGINKPAVAIRHIERQIIERGWEEGWVVPEPASRKSGMRVAVVGSGPAGLAAAQQLARSGHDVVVFERADRIGGILRYGIPDFKLPKWVLDRRLRQMEAEGVVFEVGASVGVDISISYLLRSYHAVLLAGGATVPRDLAVPGRELAGVHFAMEFLIQQNRRFAGDVISDSEAILATGKHVLVIGGGDTGADCVGTCVRQGAASIRQLEILPRPPVERDPSTPWPEWPLQLRSSSSHQEGGERHWAILTQSLKGDTDGKVSAAQVVDLEWSTDPESGRSHFTEQAGTERELPAELVLIAMGFTREGNAGILQHHGVECDQRQCAVLDSNCMSTVPGVFVAGDLAQGASLVVRAIADGRRSAEGINRYLEQQSPLERY